MLGRDTGAIATSGAISHQARDIRKLAEIANQHASSMVSPVVNASP